MRVLNYALMLIITLWLFSSAIAIAEETSAPAEEEISKPAEPEIKPPPSQLQTFFCSNVSEKWR